MPDFPKIEPSPMDPLELVQKKLREADFFLDRLRASAPTGEEADFNLSAFLSAAKAAANRLKGFEKFEKTRPERERQLWNLMTSERNWDVHRVTPDTKRIEQGEQAVTVGGHAVATDGIPVVIPPCLCFVWEGKNVPAVKLCSEFAATLRRMINDYCAQEQAGR